MNVADDVMDISITLRHRAQVPEPRNQATAQARTDPHRHIPTRREFAANAFEQPLDADMSLTGTALVMDDGGQERMKLRAGERGPGS